MMNKSLRNVLLAGAAVAVPATINALIASRVGRAEQPLPGDLAYYDWVYGRVAYYRLGQGEPLVLIHNPNAGGSSWEWRKVFPELANHYTVFALDLLGFGLSDKPNVGYSGRMLAELVHDFLEDVIGAPFQAIGSGLGASYLVNVAVRRPDGLRKLVLVNPTGMAAMTSTPVETATWGAMRAPVLGTSLYNAMVSRQAMTEELRRHIYYDPAMATDAVVNDLYTFAHQPGSQYAAAAFMAGRLCLPMRMAFSSLSVPTLMIWGRDAYYTPVGEAMDLLYRHPQARLEILDECGMLPHDEKAGEFLQLATEFLRKPAGGVQAA
ncbi:MAG: alpha/beta fold hydrolase [Armatimonadota bacterium]